MRDRAGQFRTVAASTLAFVIALFFAPSTSASISPDRPLVLIVVGASGEDVYQPIFAKSEKLWREAALKGGSEVITIGLGAEASPESEVDRQALQKALDSLKHTNSVPAWIVLIGHGTDNSKEAKFNLRGHDFSAAEFAQWLKPAQRPLVIVNSASASGAFIKPLSATNRVIVTATRSGAEQNFARFGQFISESIGSLEADLDKDEQTSLLEAFLMASRRVADFYKAEGRLVTEHPLIDDNGDGYGTPGDWFQGVRAVKKAQKGQGVDGRRTHQLHLVSNAADQKLSAEQRARRDELELKLNDLRDKKSAISKENYYKHLEGILLELARLYESAETAPEVK